MSGPSRPYGQTPTPRSSYPKADPLPTCRHCGRWFSTTGERRDHQRTCTDAFRPTDGEEPET